MTDDTDLRRRFASLREEAELRAPVFQTLLRSKRPADLSRRFSMAFAASVAIAVLVVGVLWLAGDRAAHDAEGSRSVMLVWRTETDFLLDTPGREVLSSIPRFDAPSMSDGPLSAPPSPPSIPPRSSSERSS